MTPVDGPEGRSRFRLEDFYLIGALLLFMSWLLPWWDQVQHLGVTTSFSDAVGVPDRAAVITAGNPVFQGTAALIYLVSGLVLAFRLDMRRVSLAALIPAALLLWAWASWTWAQDPDLCLRRVVALTGSSLLAAHLATRPWRQVLLLVTTAVTIACATSLAAALVIPASTIHLSGDHAGSIRGLFLQKNTAGHMAELGLVAGLGLLVAGRDPESPRWHRTLLLVALATCTGLLLASGSRTSLVLALVAGTLFLLFLPTSRPTLRQSALAGACAGLAIALVVVVDGVMAEPDPTRVDLAGRDLTATGRTYLWSASFPYVLERLATGWGYRCFWTGQGPSGDIWSAVGWDPPNAHNSWLEVTLDLGIPGLVLLLALLIGLLWRARPGGGLSREIRYWTWTLVMGSLLHGSVESLLLEANNLAWILILSTYLALVARLPDALRTPSRHPA